MISHICANWGFSLMLVFLPLYIKQVLKYPLLYNALLSALPFTSMYIFSCIFVKLMHYLRHVRILSVKQARKISTGIASIIPMICYAVLTRVECQRTIAMSMILIIVTSYGAMFAGFYTNHIDIAPNHAGMLMSITTTVATIPSLLEPHFVIGLTIDNVNIILCILHNHII